MMANESLSSDPFTQEDKVKQGFYTVVFVLGTVGNVLVLIVVAGRRERRTVNDIFIVNLAIADLTYLFFCLPTQFFLTVGDVPSDFYCRFVWPMMTVSICLSIFTLTSMAIHRRQVILNPFKPEIKHRYVVLWIFIIWVLGFVVVVPLMVVTKSNSVEPYGCEENWPSNNYRKAYTAGLFVSQYALPLTIIAVEYIRIAIDLFRPRGRKTRGDTRRAIDPARRKENIQVIKTLATIVTLFALTMLPAQLAWMLIDFGGPNEIKVGNAFLRICEWLLYTHACLNPIVYGSLTKHYRRGYIRYITLIVCCRCKALFQNHTIDETATYETDSSSNASPKERRWKLLGCIKQHHVMYHQTNHETVKETSLDNVTNCGDSNEASNGLKNNSNDPMVISESDV